jgi:hypothetical protein
MSNVSLSAAAPAPLRSLAGVPADASPALPRQRTFFSLISNVAAASMRLSCAPRWRHAFGGSDAAGAWDWKTAYDACEAATVLFMRKFGPCAFGHGRVAGCRAVHARQDRGLLPTHTRRSEESQALAAILDAARARVCRRQRCCDHPGRSRARAFGRHGPARHLRRDRGGSGSS